MKRAFAVFCAWIALLGCVSCGTTGGTQKDAESVEYELRIDSAKREYRLGESFSPQIMVSLLGIRGGKIVSQRILGADETEIDFSAFDASREGDYEIAVILKESDLKTYYTVQVRAAAAEEVLLEGQRLRFALHDPFETGDLAVTIRFADGGSLLLGEGEYTVDSLAYNAEEAGAYEIVVKPEHYAVEARYTVYVKDVFAPSFRDEISILAIGNSFSQDAVRYLYDILHGYGFQTIDLANLMMSGASLAQHCENLRHDTAAYEFERNTSGTWTTDSKKRSISYGIDLREWDIIVIQQVSGFAGDKSSYGEDFDTLLDFVSNRVAAKKTRIFWQMTWAYQSDSTHADFAKYGNDQSTMYAAITDTVRAVVEPQSNIDGIIPSATAVQNLRTGSPGDHVTRDGFHMNLVFGRYLVGLTWACAITGKDPAQAVPAGGVSETLLPEIKQSVSYALADPYNVTSLASRRKYDTFQS